MEFAVNQVCSLNLVHKRIVIEKNIIFPRMCSSQYSYIPESKYSRKSEAKPNQGGEGKCI